MPIKKVRTAQTVGPFRPPSLREDAAVNYFRASKTRAFGRVVGKVTGLPVDFADERLTTVQAEDLLALGGVKKRDMKKYTDKLSAQIILNDYIVARKRQRS